MLSPELTQRAKQLTQAQTPFVLATVVRAQSPTAGKPGDKALVTLEGDIYGWIGGGCAQPAVVKTARQVLKNQEPALIRVEPGKEVQVEDGVVSFRSSCPSGGTLDIFIEPAYQRPVLWVFGSSPVAIKLAELAAVAEFDVHVAAPLGEAEQFPLATHFQNDLDFSPEHMQGSSFAIVATQGKRDIASLQAALTLPARFLGFVASAKKAAKYKQDLIGKGYNTEDVERIVSPVGVEMGAMSPVDIALSILTQVTRVKNAPLQEAALRPVTGSDTESRQTQPSGSEQNKGGCCGG